MTQKTVGWQDETIKNGKIGDTNASSIDVTSGGTITVSYDTKTNKVNFSKKS